MELSVNNTVARKFGMLSEFNYKLVVTERAMSIKEIAAQRAIDSTVYSDFNV